MRVFVAILLVAAAVVAEDENPCSKEQDNNFEVERLLAHNDCDKFYKCVNGKPVEMFCPDGLFFNTVFRFCDWTLNVDCGERKIPFDKVLGAKTGEESEPVEKSEEEEGGAENSETAEIEFLENGCPVDPVIHWLLPHEQNCTIFFYCVWGEKVERACPNSLHFNTELQVCDWPQFANCTAKDVTSTSTVPTSLNS